MRKEKKETETRKGNVSTTGERNVKERKAETKKKDAKDGKMGKSNANSSFDMFSGGSSKEPGVCRNRNREI